MNAPNPITELHACRERFTEIVERLSEERNLSWREAWKIAAANDAVHNDRILFRSFAAFERWRLRNHAHPSPLTDTSFTEIFDEFLPVGKSVYEEELLVDDNAHVNQCNPKGRDWLDIEEERYEKNLEARLLRHGGRNMLARYRALKRRDGVRY